jgi:drug/metabolite transporter (DMT)-like permease
MPEATRTRATIVAAFLTIYLTWGTTFLAIRIAVETIPPFMVAGLRFFLAGGVMLPILLLQGGRFPGPRRWRAATIAAGLMLTGGIGLLTYAETRIPSGLAALMVATIPVWITALGWLGFGGAALLFAPALGSQVSNYDLVGMGSVSLGAFSFACGSLYARRAPLPEDTWIATASEMLAGGVLLLLIGAVVGEPLRLDVATVSTRSLLALAYLIVFGSIVSYTAYLWLLKTVEPAKAGTNFYVNPVVAVVAGALVLGEVVTVPMIVAAAVILVGVAVINTAPPRGETARRREAVVKREAGAVE